MEKNAKKRGRTAAAPDKKRNHQIPVTLDGHEKARLNYLMDQFNQKVREAGLPISASESTLVRALIRKEFDRLNAESIASGGGEIVLLPVIKVDSESEPESSTGTDD